MILRGQRVFVRCDEHGELRPDGGRVEIRYKPNDGRAYQAGVKNLEPSLDATVLPDEHCGPAERPEDKGGKGAKSGGSKSRSKKKKPAPSSFPTTPAEGEVLAYCDGACSGNPGPAGLGAVIRSGGEEIALSEYLGDGTNNIAELTAILRVLQEAPEGPLTVHTDSSYAIGLLTKGWKAKKNQELVAELRAALKARGDTDFVYVPGHAGVQLNELADQLAVAAVEARDSYPVTRRPY
tara:strand:+ start:724 stop:1434 length:711 start_codon:yes stop_codon:yes gene_type:complete